MTEKTNETRTRRDYSIKLYDDEVAAIRNITKVDAIAPAVVALLRKAIEENKNG